MDLYLYCLWKQRLGMNHFEPLMDLIMTLPGLLMLLWPLYLNNNGINLNQDTSEEPHKLMCLHFRLWTMKQPLSNFA
jgi:hypothetical protein